MAQITYADKSTLNENASVPAVNKIQASDMNEIKNIVNENNDLVGDLANLDTTNKSSIVEAMNELFTMGVDSYQLGTTGHIRFKNGIQIAWTEKNCSFSMSAWGQVFYADITNMPNWSKPFTQVYQQYATAGLEQYWFANGDGGNTKPGIIRVLRPTGGNYTQWIKVFAIGRWK